MVGRPPIRKVQEKVQVKEGTVVIYCRVSTGDQSCDRQVRDLESFCVRSGFTVAGVFKETASGSKTDRAERQRVMALAQARQIDAVVVTELTRWGRSTVDLLSTLQTLNEYGVSVIAEKGMQFDLSTAQGKMLATVLASLAQFEKDLLVERTKSGLEAAKARGVKLGPPCTGNRTDAKHRSAVLELQAAGISQREIAKKLKIGKETVWRITRDNKNVPC